jgi:hypothetical protein
MAFVLTSAPGVAWFPPERMVIDVLVQSYLKEKLCVRWSMRPSLMLLSLSKVACVSTPALSGPCVAFGASLLLLSLIETALFWLSPIVPYPHLLSPQASILHMSTLPVV